MQRDSRPARRLELRLGYEKLGCSGEEVDSRPPKRNDERKCDVTYCTHNTVLYMTVSIVAALPILTRHSASSALRGSSSRRQYLPETDVAYAVLGTMHITAACTSTVPIPLYHFAKRSDQVCVIR